MYRRDGEIILSPTDLTKHLACRHATTLDLLALDGSAVPGQADDALELIFKLGLEHEDRYLESLKAQGKSVVEIPGLNDRAEQERLTLVAMQQGADVVYQATLVDVGWAGYADFLLRVERPSALGDWSYDVADTKLARKMKVPALLQMATYAERLTVLQGVAPEQLVVVTGDGLKHPWRLVDVAAFTRRARARLRLAVETRPMTESVPVSHCGQCRWVERCDQGWRASDDLSLVAFMRGDHRQLLREHGVTTLAQLGQADVEALRATGISRTSLERLVHQASLQLWEREHKKPRYDLLLPEEERGLLRLPPPDPADLYLDFEGDPYAEQGDGREYLAGLGDRHDGFEPLWAHDPAQEKALTIALVDRLLAHWLGHPGMHVYHYAPYETTALKRLVQRHGVREAELDQLLRGQVFVDLYAVVRQGMRISKGSYSIKKMEHFYWGHIRNNNPDVADAMSSVLAYERWMEERDDSVLDQILAYNKDDVLSTLALHDWLEVRRDELESLHGPQPRPGAGPAPATTQPGALELLETALADQLMEAGEDLLAGLVLFHRREARPAYWDLFRLADLEDEELVDDSAALGMLSAPVDVGAIARSRMYRYEFPPQDTKIKVGDKVNDVDDQKPAGTVLEIDAERGFIVVKRQAAARLSRGFTEKQVVGDQVIREAIQAVAGERLAGATSLGSALLDHVVPSALTSLLETGLALDGQVLAVQGPPGTGKTTQGAELVRALLDKNLRVGITANSHAVVGHFLRAVGRPAVQVCSPDDFLPVDGLIRAESADARGLIDGGAKLVGGTAWLWSRVDMAGSIDVLVVDEAAQFSLANAVGTSRAATSLVLLGDPQQLPQVTQAQHPHGAGVSALGHLIDGHETIPADRGIFLPETKRMHPALAEFVSDLAYEGRLHSLAGLEQQQLVGGVSGSGLRMLSVSHEGRASGCPEEVVAVASLLAALLRSSFQDRHGAVRSMTADDVLIVAPYNDQVARLRAALPGARVGTVDKFQGQQAPVVIYSMTSSSASDAPRGVDFLYDLHRLNVAVSRAQAMAVVVMNPELLEAAVNTPEQLRKVNALCRLVEQALPRATKPGADPGNPAICL